MALKTNEKPFGPCNNVIMITVNCFTVFMNGSSILNSLQYYMYVTLICTRCTSRTKEETFRKRRLFIVTSNCYNFNCGLKILQYVEIRKQKMTLRADENARQIHIFVLIQMYKYFNKLDYYRDTFYKYIV